MAGTEQPRWEKFAGIRIVGDVHGEAEAFGAAVEGARVRRLFVVQIGDLIDGPDSPEALRIALDLCEQNRGLVLRGNHDDKLRRALRGNPVKIGPELRRSLDGISAAPDHASLVPRVRTMLETARWWLNLGEHFVVHGAFHPAMITATDPEAISARRVAGKSKWLALYGEGRITGDDNSLPERTYGWIDTVPRGLTVVIGHDVISTERIAERTGAIGGRVLFLDTGCGKGGKLSFLDLAPPL